MPENLYKRGNVWWVRVKSNGREHRKSLRTGTLSVARKRAKAFKDDIEARTHDGEKKWEEAVIAWRKDIQVKDSTRERYQISLRNCLPALKGKYLSEIDKPFLASLTTEQRESGLTTATIKRNLTAISSVFDVAEANDWVDRNPAREFAKRLKERRDPIALPREEDIDFVVKGAPGNFANMIRFAQHTGMRLEEIADLTWGQVRGNVIDLTKTKTNTPRSFEMNDMARGTLKGTEKHTEKKHVFWHGEGSRYHNVSSQFRRIARQCIKAAEKEKRDFRPFRFHDLRHWYAVNYLREGGSIYTLQKILGHASIKTTEIYLRHLTPEEAEVAQFGAQQRWFDGEEEGGDKD
jgi:integrase/recombinase XerD